MSPEQAHTTRKRRIDPRLTAAGWSLAPFDPSKPLLARGKTMKGIE